MHGEKMFKGDAYAVKISFMFDSWTTTLLSSVIPDFFEMQDLLVETKFQNSSLGKIFFFC